MKIIRKPFVQIGRSKGIFPVLGFMIMPWNESASLPVYNGFLIFLSFWKRGFVAKLAWKYTISENS